MRNWIALSGWAMAARIARPAGRLVGWCASWAALTGFVAVVVTVAFLAWWKIIAIYVVAVLLVAAWRARRHLVIAEITDNSSDGRLATGAAALRVDELARIRDDFRYACPVNEKRADKKAGLQDARPPEFITDMEGFAAALRSVVTAESKITIGLVSIPVGALAAMLGHFVREPSLTATFHDADGRVVLAALLTGANQHHAWQVERTRECLPQGPAPESVVRDLVSELELGPGAAVRADTSNLAASIQWNCTDARDVSAAVRSLMSAVRLSMRALAGARFRVGCGNADPDLMRGQADAASRFLLNLAYASSQERNPGDSGRHRWKDFSGD